MQNRIGLLKAGTLFAVTAMLAVACAKKGSDRKGIERVTQMTAEQQIEKLLKDEFGDKYDPKDPKNAEFAARIEGATMTIGIPEDDPKLRHVTVQFLVTGIVEPITSLQTLDPEGKNEKTSEVTKVVYGERCAQIADQTFSVRSKCFKTKKAQGVCEAVITMFSETTKDQSGAEVTKMAAAIFNDVGGVMKTHWSAPFKVELRTGSRMSIAEALNERKAVAQKAGKDPNSVLTCAAAEPSDDSEKKTACEKAGNQAAVTACLAMLEEEEQGRLRLRDQYMAEKCGEAANARQADECAQKVDLLMEDERKRGVLPAYPPAKPAAAKAAETAVATFINSEAALKAECEKSGSQTAIEACHMKLSEEKARLAHRDEYMKKFCGEINNARAADECAELVDARIADEAKGKGGAVTGDALQPQPAPQVPAPGASMEIIPGG